MRAYSLDLRVRVLADCDAGMNTAAVAGKYSVSTAWVRRLKQRCGDGLGIEPLKGRPGPKPSLAQGDDANRLRRLAATEPDLSAQEYRDRLGLVAARRDQWRNGVIPGLDVGRVVFIDETAAKTDMARTHGYAPRGRRLEGSVPYRRWQTTTLVGAMRMAGFVAPLVVDGAMTGELFEAYIRRVLLAELREGDVVVLDNLSSHRRAGVREAIEGKGCTLLLLPAYSPDLNPIELAFAKLKRLLRQAAARTVEALWNAIGRLLDRFGAEECRNYIRHAGYLAI
jgi:transposase